MNESYCIICNRITETGRTGRCFSCLEPKPFLFEDIKLLVADIRNSIICVLRTLRGRINERS